MAQTQSKLFGEPETKEEVLTEKLQRKHIENAVAFPVIVHGGWDVPKTLRQHIVASRIAQLEKDPERFIKYATDSEAVAYLMTASLSFPFTHEWAQIYMHVVGKYMTEKGMKQLPDFIDDVKLSEYEKAHLLKPLKRWIREKQSKHMKGKASESRRQGIKSNDKTAPEPPVLRDSTYAA